MAEIHPVEMASCSRQETLELLSQCSDDVDTTRSVDLVFDGPILGIQSEAWFQSFKKVAKKPAKDVQVDVDTPKERSLEWPCGGKCGSMVQRVLKYNGKFPKLVFCRRCSAKRRASWRARVCRALGCKKYVQYKFFEYQVQGRPEPELCRDCAQQDHVERKQEEDPWRMKHCLECKQQVEFYLPEEPQLCQDCACRGVCRQGELEDTDCSDVGSTESESDDEWSLISDSLPQIKKYPNAKCEECQAQVTDKGRKLTCQSSKHFFFLCGTNGCDKKFEKKCEERAEKRGKSGKKKIEFAQHRGSCPCPTCGLRLQEGTIESEIQASFITDKGPTCFPWGTLMLLPGEDGTLKPIQNLRKNDKIVCALGDSVEVKSIECTEEANQDWA